ncbi:MAG: hypothetical protein OEX04_07630 [Acidimicrobiia bacterium]|nr:hypothetical protein [Acidimicrobiia bacterium]MDH4307335.1 hypothetical protein [Acidimicrobiia bacterium]MDH5294474.1 hypothetical protein [Acidimicrobiia bacterium]
MLTDNRGDAVRSDVPGPARRPFWSRMSVGQIVMVVAALAAFVLNVNAIRSQEAVTMVAVAGDDLTPGVVFDASMVEFVSIDAENPVVARLVTDNTVDALAGKIVTSRILQGEFVAVADLADEAADEELRAFTVPVDASHAGGGGLIGRGDLVDIISVSDGVATYVVTGAQVLAVPESETGGLVAVNDYFVVVAVDADTALSIAEALQADSIEVVLATGASTPERLTLPRPETAETTVAEEDG